MPGSVTTGMGDQVRGSAPGGGKSILVYNQSSRSTQFGQPSVGKRNEYEPKDGDACGWGVKASMIYEWMAGNSV